MALVRSRIFQLSVLLFACFLPSCSRNGLLRDGSLNEKFVRDVAARTAEVRGLPLRGPLPIELVEAGELRGELIASIERDVGAETLAAEEALYRGLGLLPADLSLHDVLVDLLTEQTAGYYDTEQRVMRLVDGNTSLGGMLDVLGTVLQRDIGGEFLLAHELAHALSDQNFDLRAYMQPVGNSDADAARSAFVEGEAMLVGLYYVIGKPLRKVAWAAHAEHEETGWNAAPPFLKRQLLFAYGEGLRFVMALYNRAGTAALNRAYVRPPRSTEQILHPEKYLNESDEPVVVAVPPPLPEWQGARAVTDDTYGELGVLALLEQDLGFEQARIAAEGWGGDRYGLYAVAGEAPGIGFAWDTVWDDEHHAREFADRISRLLAGRFGESADGSWSGERGRASLMRADSRSVGIRLFLPGP